MDWLIDAQLPPRLCAWFHSHGEHAVHVSDLENGLLLPDETLWNYARDREYIIVSKDRDFYDRSLLYGAPPQVLYITVGNCSNDRLIEILEYSWKEITSAIREQCPLVAVSQESVQKY
jgi:predicted nuclease of predicted toxin-antitoxin system